MNAERQAEIVRLRDELTADAAAFVARHGAEVDDWRHVIAAGVGDALARFQRDVAEISHGDALCADVAARAADYVEWLQWTLWDLPALAVALQPERERFRRAAAACGLVYLSLRVLDDLVDRHYLYRGRRATLLADLCEQHGGARGEALTLLAATLLAFEGLSHLTQGESTDGDALTRLRQVVDSVRRAVIGALLELNGAASFDPERYALLARLKNVDYWRVLYAALDPALAAPLHAFLSDYYALAQMLNDVQDHAADESRGQPNLLALRRDARATHAGEPEGLRADVVGAVAEELANEFLALDAHSARLPEREREVARFKLREQLDEAFRLGVFEGGVTSCPGARGAGAPRFPAAPELRDGGSRALRRPARPHCRSGVTSGAAYQDLGLGSSFEELAEALGPDAFEDVACPVCAGRERAELFRKQGFAFTRCRTCSHVYVSPRLRAELRDGLAQRAADANADGYLLVQRIYAEFLARHLAHATHGRRLLDVGFGRGDLLRLARAAGFEVYGLETRDALLEPLRPAFGQHLARFQLGGEPLPWGGFDVVVLSHVLEHLPDPGASLLRVREALVPGGLLYVAVPDMDALQFRVFGRRWEIFHPLVHEQYFTRASLERLLEQAGLVEPAPVVAPPFRSAPRWMQLFRAHGGSESGELALLARRPHDDAPPPA